MSVLIKGMEKPEHCGYCRFRYDGICHALQKTQYSMNECPLVVIDDAGLNDTISRQAAIDAICEHGTDLERRGITVLAVANHKQATVDLLEKLPSIDAVQVIRCKDCKYNKENTLACGRYGLEDDDYCSWAERKDK